MLLASLPIIPFLQKGQEEDDHNFKFQQMFHVLLACLPRCLKLLAKGRKKENHNFQLMCENCMCACNSFYSSTIWQHRSLKKVLFLT